MNSTIIEKIKNNNLHYILAVLFMAIIVYIVFNYSILYVTVSTPNNLPKITDYNKLDHHISDTTQSNTNATYTDNIVKNEDKVPAQTEVSLDYDYNNKIIGKPGLHLVKRGANKIIAKAGDTETSSVFSMPWYGFLHKKLEIKLDKNADKIAYYSTLRNPCGVWNEDQNKLAQYDCESPSVLSFYDTPENTKWLIQSISKLSYSKTLFANYRGGLLGLVESSGDPFIESVSIDGKKSNYPLPDNMNCSQSICLEDDKTVVEKSVDQKTPSRIFTNTKDQNSNLFIFVDSNGSIHLGQIGQENEVSYKRIPASDGYDSSIYQTICDIANSKAYCYQGLSNYSSPDKNSSNNHQSSLVISDFNSNDTTTFQLKDNLKLNYLGVTNDGKIFAKEDNSLIQIKHQGDSKKVTEIKIADDIDKVATAKDLYFTYNRSVYRLDSNTLDTHLVFKSSNIRPTQLILTNNNVIFLGKAPRTEDTVTYAWKLNNEDNLTPGLRTIDRLPSSSGSITFGTTDLVGDKIYIKIHMDRGSPSSKIEEEKNRIITNLKRSGIDTDKFKVVTSAM